MLRKSAELKKVSFGVFVLAALFTIPVYLTGEGAEEIVETYEESSHDVIHEHEETAEKVIWGMGLLGVLALGGLLFFRSFSGEADHLRN